MPKLNYFKTPKTTFNNSVEICSGNEFLKFEAILVKQTTIHRAKGVTGTQPYLEGKGNLSSRVTSRKRK